MKTKRRTVTALALVALAALVSLGVFRGTQRAHAQDTIPPPQPERISFGMIGITPGQTIRLNVVNVVPPPNPELPPSPIRVVLTFLNSDGQLFRNRDGNPVRRVAMLEPGESTFLNLSGGEFAGGVARLHLRAVVTVIPPPQPDSQSVPPPIGDRIVTTVEVLNNATGRTDLVLSGPPSVQKVPPPIPD